MALRATYRFTTDEYHRLAEAGILEEDDRIELLDGELIIMPPIGDDHCGRVNSLTRKLSRRNPERWLVSVQNPIVLDAYSEPQPDLALLRLDPRAFTRKPTPADVLVLIEVADSSLAYDRGNKLTAYARAAVPEVWIVNLLDDVLEVYREPRGERYERTLTLRRGESVSPVLVPDVALEVAELLL